MASKLPPKATGKAKSFLDELSAFAEEQRRIIGAECDGFPSDNAARDRRATQATNDYAFFVQTYFPHYIKAKPSVFHTWFFSEVPQRIDMPTGQLLDISESRGGAKSTMGTQLLTLWCVITGRKRFIPIVMDSFDQAATMLEAVKVELEDNPRLAMDFPDACGRGRVWNVGAIVTRNNAKIQAFGSGKKMRGLRHGPHRPDLVILDDIENDENVRSPEQRDKLEQWLKKVVIPLGPPDGSMDIVYLNTILHYDSVANRTHKNPLWLSFKFKAIIKWPDRMDLWQLWEEIFINEGQDASDAYYQANRADMDAGAVVSWPDMRPLLKLMKIRASDRHAFDCEYQNDPTNDEAALFKEVTFWVQPSRDWVFYGVNDPSLGKNNRKRDPCAILVGGFDRNHGVLDVVEAKVARMIPDRQISTIIELQREYLCQVWGIESIQFQEFFRQQLVKASARAGVPVPAIPLIPHTDKVLRIESLSPHVSNGLIRLHPSQTVLLDQLRHFPEADHDDGPDALHMLWMLAVSRAGGIPKVIQGPRRYSIQLPSPIN
jgi:predicted phage terminase large subunit-like protein